MRNLLMPESKYRIESYEPTPGQKRTQNMSELLQAIGGFTDRNNIPFLSSYADPRNANRTARQINNAYETVGDFIPGVSYELAKERNDDLGQNLAMLDLIPGGALPKKAIKGVQQVDFSTAVNRFKTNNPKSADYDKFVETKSEFIQGKMQDALNSSSIIQDPKNKAKYLKNTIREIENQLTNDFGKRGILDEVVDTSYRLDLQERGREFDDAIQLDNLSKDVSGNRGGYPEDFYTPRGQKIYAPGPRFPDDEFGIANEQSYKEILKARGNPDAEVTIYRGVPKGIKKINEGDFVTLSPKYAELHSIDQLDYRPPGSPRGDVSGDVISQKVKVKDLIWDGNDVNEFGYFPIK